MADVPGTPEPSINPLLGRRVLGRLREFAPELAASRVLPTLEERPAEPLAPAGADVPPEAPPAAPPPAPKPVEAPPTGLPAAPPPMPTPPLAPPANPFAELPFPSAGDRIKADDFRRLSQSLRVLYDTYALSGATFGYPFGQVKLALAAQQYEIARVVSVYGTELADVTDASLDNRKVLQVAPVVLGERRVTIVVTDAAAADTIRHMPNLLGLTYRQAADRIQSELGDAVARGGPMVVPDLTGLTITEATRRVSG